MKGETIRNNKREDVPRRRNNSRESSREKDGEEKSPEKSPCIVLYTEVFRNGIQGRDGCMQAGGK